MVKQVVDLDVYNFALSIADEVWLDVNSWQSFNRYSIGRQLIMACDSIAANIAEGHGRYHHKEMINFLYYSRGSLEETKCWLLKAKTRSLIDPNRYDHLIDLINILAPKLNAFINAIKARNNNK